MLVSVSCSDEELMDEVWSQAMLVLSSSAAVGHALMATVICQQLSTSEANSNIVSAVGKVGTAPCNYYTN